MVEVLRHTGIRIEELTELSHHSLIQYRVPATGELIPLEGRRYSVILWWLSSSSSSQQDVGGTKGEDTQWFRMHDSGRSTQLRDGMFIGTPRAEPTTTPP